MNIEANDLRGNWYNNEFIVYSFYPQDKNSTDLKCSINMHNDGKLIYDGDVSLEKNIDNNSYILTAGEHIFEIKGLNKATNSMSIYSNDFGNIEVDKK
ncbi:hypothetical protein [Flavobacterium taihuense]|uniref:Uncharacterized protein n=1 Tax=Flavobacterium taihuense TaxID=2857508 RepID=A0ABS6XYS7_9FLAO|nr:hypothetical protein [Flavobacterium taihuense]MBW4361024.1 hypothetical protein [Flavobacterium taihuense]